MYFDVDGGEGKVLDTSVREQSGAWDSSRGRYLIPGPINVHNIFGRPLYKKGFWNIYEFFHDLNHLAMQDFV